MTTPPPYTLQDLSTRIVAVAQALMVLAPRNPGVNAIITQAFPELVSGGQITPLPPPRQPVPPQVPPPPGSHVRGS